MRYQTAELSLIGDRDQNQDRVAGRENRGRVLSSPYSMAWAAIPMASAPRKWHRIDQRQVSGSHPNPSRTRPASSTTGQEAHEAVVSIGSGLSVEHKPRATCAVCLVHQGRAWWAHVGDARIYLLRGPRWWNAPRPQPCRGASAGRPDHAGGESPPIPMRHYVEACLGGESGLPDLSLPNFRGSADRRHPAGLLGRVWSGLSDEYLAIVVRRVPTDLGVDSGELAEKAVAANGPHSDNTTARRVARPRRLSAGAGNPTLMSGEQHMRPSGRRPDQLRPVRFTRRYTRHAEGSVLSNSVTRSCSVPRASRNACRPSCGQRARLGHRGIRHVAPRDAHPQRAGGGARETGRAHPGDPAADRPILRAVTDLSALGEMTITLDCDVLQADGGTRTAAITGGLRVRCRRGAEHPQTGRLRQDPVYGQIAAVSVGIYRENRCSIWTMQRTRKPRPT